MRESREKKSRSRLGLLLRKNARIVADVLRRYGRCLECTADARSADSCKVIFSKIGRAVDILSAIVIVIHRLLYNTQFCSSALSESTILFFYYNRVLPQLLVTTIRSTSKCANQLREDNQIFVL